VKRLYTCTLFSLGFLLVGCYTLEPTGGIAPAPGLGVALDINDQGRVTLGGQVGPEISQIEGRLISKDSAEYVVAVNVVRLLRGGEQVWRGEQIHIKSSYVSTVYAKQFSKARTVAAVAVGVGLVAAVFGQKLFGDGPRSPDPVLPDTSNTIRIPLLRP